MHALPTSVACGVEILSVPVSLHRDLVGAHLASSCIQCSAASFFRLDQGLHCLQLRLQAGCKCLECIDPALGALKFRGAGRRRQIAGVLLPAWGRANSVVAHERRLHGDRPSHQRRRGGRGQGRSKLLTTADGSPPVLVGKDECHQRPVGCLEQCNATCAQAVRRDE